MLVSTPMQGRENDAMRDAEHDAPDPSSFGDVTALPRVGKPGAHHRPASALQLTHIMTVIGHVIFAAVAVAVMLIFRTELVTNIVLLGALPLLAVTMLLDLVLWNRWEQRYYSYTVTDDFVYITSGRFFRNTKTLPTPHILGVETQQGPIQRRLQLMTLQFTTITAQQELGPIAPADAERIRDGVTRVLLGHRDD